MALEAYFKSNGQLAMPLIQTNVGSGGFLESSSSRILPEKEGYSGSLPVDLPLSMVRMEELNRNLASGDVSSTLLDKFMNPRSILGTGSLVADSDLMLPIGALLHMSGGANMKPHVSLSSSPRLSSSVNLSNSVMEGPPIAQQTSFLDQSSEQGRKRQRSQKVEGSAPLTDSKSQNYNFSLPFGMKQEPSTLIQMLKKPRMDFNPDNALQQQILQQLLRQNLNQFHDGNPQPKALQHYRPQNQLQKRISHSVPQLPRVHVLQPEQKMRNHLQQPSACSAPSMHSIEDVCSRRLAQYLNSLQNRPQDNSIDFWRKFVSEFYAPCAKERWCLSSYENIGQHALGVLSLGAIEEWCCDICGSRSGKGFEASFEILPRLWKIKFESGALEEILYLEFPRECRFPSGVMLLEYEKAVQESVYEHFRVVREGKLRVTFRHDLKILSWEFCACRHEEYVLRRLITPQVNQLLHAAQKYQGALSDGASDKASGEDLQATFNIFLKAGQQLARNLELPMVNDLGFSKRLVRCVQIAEVVHIMKDLMTFSHANKMGPIASLQAYTHKHTMREVQGYIQTEAQETSQKGSTYDLLMDRNQSTTMHVGPDIYAYDACATGDKFFPESGAGDVELMMANYYQNILRENLFNPKPSIIKPDQACLMDSSSQRAVSSFPIQQSPTPRTFHNSVLTALPSLNSPKLSKNIQQDMNGKMLWEVVPNWTNAMQSALRIQRAQTSCDSGGSLIRGLLTMASSPSKINDGSVLGNSTAAAIGHANLFSNDGASIGSISATSGSNSPKVSGSNIAIKKEPEIPELRLPQDFQGTGGVSGQFSKPGI